MKVVTPPVRRALALSIGAGALSSALLVAFLALLGATVDRALSATGAPGHVWLVFLLLAVVAVLRAAAAWIAERRALEAARIVKTDLRARVADTLLRRGPAALARERTGGVLNTAVGGVDALDPYVSQYLPQAALAAIVPLLVAAVVLTLDPLSALVLAVTGPLIPLFMWLVGASARARTRRQWVALARLSARFVDALHALGTLKAFGRLDAETGVIARGADAFRRLTMSVLRVAFLSAFVLELLATIGTAIVAVEVGLRLLYGRLAFREAFIVLLLAPEFYRPLRALGASFHAAMSGREALARIAAMVDAAPADAHAPHAPMPVPSARPPALALERVTFTWQQGRQPALDNVSARLPAGRLTAIVGPSGAGKSTAAQLLLGFIHPDSGRVLIEGSDLSTLDHDAWRACVAWVPQHPHLFHGSLADNLRLARPDASAGDVDRAIHLACLDEVVAALPRGLETPIGERGERLSGGQAQRVALARAILKDAPVLVLDEPAAQLDLETDATWWARLRPWCASRTVVLIAHRMSRVLEADAIVVLDGGRLVEHGTPAALLRAGGTLARMAAAAGVGR